jgi:ADP-heptose:LPS heptosyltransferase
MNLEKPINILVQRRAAIGDVIMTTGVVREIKRKYGTDANIDVATDFAEPYRNNPHIRNIFPVDQVPDVKSRWDLYINLDDAYEFNPTEHYVANYFYRAFADTTRNMSVELFPTDEDRAQVDQLIKDEIGTKFIVVHLRNWHWTAKNISMDVWLEVFGKLFEERADFKIVCVGGNTDHYVEHPLFVDVRGKLNSQQIKHLCDHACCFAGVDSGPFQCAAASSTHIIALLTHLDPGCIMPHRKFELGYNSTAIVTEEDCRGCNKNQQRPVRQLICEKGNTPCNANFDVDVITQAILRQLG